MRGKNQRSQKPKNINKRLEELAKELAKEIGNATNENPDSTRLSFSLTGNLEGVRGLSGYHQLHEVCKAANVKLHFTRPVKDQFSNGYSFVVNVTTDRPYSESRDAELAPQEESAEAGSLSGGSFDYGWCTTDHKAGKEIRPGYRTLDYLQDEPFATSIKNMLDKLGLPFPQPEEIFRGTRHDLLFLNSHGVVLRIGPTDVTDMINPGVLQPLGWMEDPDIRVKELPFAIAVYPGIELYNDWLNDMHRPPIAGDRGILFFATGQSSSDHVDNNDGIIRILDDEGKEAAVKVVLDLDNKSIYSSEKLAEKRSSHMARAAEFHENMGDILSHTIESVFAEERDFQLWRRAFEAHQPLRRLFWEAFSSTEETTAAPDIAARQKFWDTCAIVTNNPHAAVVPMWRRQMQESDVPEFVREEAFVPQVILYRPWTGEAADKATQPISVDPALKESVQRDHALMVKNKESRSAVFIAPVKSPALC